MERKAYPSDLSDAEWDVIEPVIPEKKGRGRNRTLDMHEVVNAIFYLVRPGCQWCSLPHDFPNYNSVRSYYDTWRQKGFWKQINTYLRELVYGRPRKIENPNRVPPSLTVRASKQPRWEANEAMMRAKKSRNGKERKRHIVVDTLGQLLVVVHSAAIQDRDGACTLFERLSKRFSRILLMWADGGYTGGLEAIAKSWWDWVLEIVERPNTSKGFVVLPQRWMVERTFAWLGRNRRLSKDYEQATTSSESIIYNTSIRLLLRRLAQSG